MMDLSGLEMFGAASSSAFADQAAASLHDDISHINGADIDQDGEGLLLGAPVTLESGLDDVLRGVDSKFHGVFFDSGAHASGEGVPIGEDDGFVDVGDHEMVADSGAGSSVWHGESVPFDDVQPFVPELPATGACLRCTHVRTEMEADAVMEGVRTVATKLGFVISPASRQSGVVCTAMDEETGAPVDFSVQVYTQQSFTDRVIELQAAGRGDRLAFAGIYAQFMAELRRDGICGAADAAAVATVETSLPASAADRLDQPSPLTISGRASTVGGLSIASLGAAPAVSAGSDASGLSLGTADIAVPGEDGLRLVTDRLRSTDGKELSTGSAGTHATTEAAEAAASLTLRLHRLPESKLAEACSRMDASALPAVLVAVARTAVPPSCPPSTGAEPAGPVQGAGQTTALYAAAGDSVVVPALVALGRVLGCPGAGCVSLTGDAASAEAALAVLSSLAVSAAAQVATSTTALVEDARRGRSLDAASSEASPLQTGEWASADAASMAVSHTFQAPAALLALYRSEHGSAADYAADAKPQQTPLTQLTDSGDGPAALSAAYLLASGSLLRLRAAAWALLAAAQRKGPSPSSSAPTWPTLVGAAASKGIAALREAADATGDRTLGAAVASLVSCTSL